MGTSVLTEYALGKLVQGKAWSEHLDAAVPEGAWHKPLCRLLAESSTVQVAFAGLCCPCKDVYHSSECLLAGQSASWGASLPLHLMLLATVLTKPPGKTEKKKKQASRGA